MKTIIIGIFAFFTIFFWGGWYLMFGWVPTVSLNDGALFPFSSELFQISLSRIWDILFVPIWTFIILLKMEKEKNDSFSCGVLHGIVGGGILSFLTILLIMILVGHYRGLNFAIELALFVNLFICLSVGIIFGINLFFLKLNDFMAWSFSSNDKWYFNLYYGIGTSIGYSFAGALLFGLFYGFAFAFIIAIMLGLISLIATGLIGFLIFIIKKKSSIISC